MQEHNWVKVGLISLLLIAVVAVAGMIFFSGESAEDGITGMNDESTGATSAEDMMEANKTPSVSGTVVEISQKADSKDKRIILSSQNGEGEVEEYKFFLSGETITGVDDIEGGDQITVSFQGGLSTVDYVVAEGVTKK